MSSEMAQALAHLLRQTNLFLFQFLQGKQSINDE